MPKEPEHNRNFDPREVKIIGRLPFKRAGFFSCEFVNILFYTQNWV